MPTVRALEAFVAEAEGGGYVAVSAGQPFDSSDPIVKARKHLFAADNDEPRRGRTRGGVEQATAAPGELRDL